MITGGLGGLGRIVARELVGAGARHLTLVGRRGLPPRSEWSSVSDRRVIEQIDAVCALEALGAGVCVPAVDIADRAALEAWLDAHRSERRPPVGGVFHLAGTLHDGVLAGLRPETVDAVFRAKALGAWLLHRTLADEPLEHFVLFSSIAGLFGSAGQGNYAAANALLDALAEHRAAAGLPATSIAWGPWAEVGLARDHGGHLERWGIAEIDADGGARAIASLAAATTPVQVAARFDAGRLGVAAPSLARLTADLAPTGTDCAHPTPEGATAPHGRRAPSIAEVEQVVLVALAEVTGLRGDATPTSDMALQDLGVDSLVAIDLHAHLEEALGVNLPVTQLIEAGTIGELAKCVVDAASEAATDEDAGIVIQHIVLTAANGDRTVVIHPGGLDAASYAPLAAHVQGSLEVLVLPGLYEPASEAESIDRLAVRCVARIDETGPAPAIVMGWSLGGVVAFEVARRLRARGTAPHLLALLDAPNPIQVRTDPVSDTLLAPAFRSFLSAKGAPDGPTNGQLPIYRAALTKSAALIDAYAPEPYDGDAIYLAARDVLDAYAVAYPAGEAAWRGLVRGAFRASHIPGDHYSMLQTPNMTELGTALSDHAPPPLDRARRA